MVLRTILGSMTFASQTQKVEALAMVESFVAAGHNEVDTARMYNHGATEKLLGEMLKEKPLDIKLASKANPFKGYNANLTASSVTAQITETLKDLGTDAVDIYYLHAPDVKTPILETLGAVNKAYCEGKFKEFGLSNYQAWEVCHIYHLCREHGYPTPAVYQGMYNSITRQVERELLPCLRALGMRFYAYNPLAGGLLTGKLDRSKLDDVRDGSRFDVSNKMYRDRYLQEAQLDAVDMVVTACKNAGVDPASAALRWLKHHSKLADGDGIIIGASKMTHFSANLQALDQGPLPDIVVTACNFGSTAIQRRGCCPSYERGYSLYTSPP